MLISHYSFLETIDIAQYFLSWIFNHALLTVQWQGGADIPCPSLEQHDLILKRLVTVRILTLPYGRCISISLAKLSLSFSLSLNFSFLNFRSVKNFHNSSVRNSHLSKSFQKPLFTRIIFIKSVHCYSEF